MEEDPVRPTEIIFTALRTVEDDPGLKRFAEIKKSVLDAGGHEEKIAGIEGNHLLSNLESSGTAYNHIAFVSAMRLLRVYPLRNIEFHLKPASFQPHVKPVSCCIRNVPGHCLRR